MINLLIRNEAGKGHSLIFEMVIEPKWKDQKEGRLAMDLVRLIFILSPLVNPITFPKHRDLLSDKVFHYQYQQ